jgi:hypothetical protein
VTLMGGRPRRRPRPGGGGVGIDRTWGVMPSSSIGGGAERRAGAAMRIWNGTEVATGGTGRSE